MGNDLGYWSLKWCEEIHDAKGNKVAFANHFPFFFSKRHKKTHWKMDEFQSCPQWYKDFKIEVHFENNYQLITWFFYTFGHIYLFFFILELNL